MQEIRWQQRFDNFEKALVLLKSADAKGIYNFNELEQEGFIKRFEFGLELAWKTIKDKMEFDGIVLDKISPKFILKTAYNSKYIDNINIWLGMVSDRNLMSHTYDKTRFEKVLENISNDYLLELENLYNNLKNEYRTK